MLEPIADVARSKTPPKTPPSTSTSSMTVLLDSDPELDSNFDKYRKLAKTCVKNGQISPTEKAILERFRVRYGISDAQSDEIIAEFLPKSTNQEAFLEYGLMYRAFLENDLEIDAEEQGQLLELQEELKITNEQVEVIEANVKEELGLQ